MRSWEPALAAALARPGVVAHLALAVDVRDVAAGLMRRLGWWTGGWEVGLPVDGVTRVFSPAGAALQAEDLEPQSGARSRRYRVSLLGQDDDLSAATRDMDLARSPAWLWRVVLDPDDRSNRWMIPLMRGWVDEVEARAGTPSEPGGLDIFVVTSAEALTWALPDRRYNDATMRRRRPGSFTVATLDIASDGTTALDAGIELIDIELIGGGGGGAGSSGAGGDGGRTVLELLDGTTVVRSWVALGGEGGISVGVPQAGEASALSPYGDGGDAGTATGQGGRAGDYLKISGIDVTGLASPQVNVVIGTGGTSPGGQPGSAGKAIVHQLTRTGAADEFFRWSSIAAEVKRPW